jgi:hypothetical protein
MHLRSRLGHLCEICHDTEVVRRLMAQAIIVARKNNRTGGFVKTRQPIIDIHSGRRSENI